MLVKMLACEMLVALSLVAAATACLAQSPFTSPVEAPKLFSRASGCSVSGQASCHNTTVQNTCCFESPGVNETEYNIYPFNYRLILYKGSSVADSGMKM